MPFLTGVFGYIKPRQDQIFNILLGLSFIYWAFAGFYKDLSILSTVRVCTSILNIVIGILIILRSKELKKAKPKALLFSLPSLILGGLLFKFALPFTIWSSFLQIIFALASIFTILSFLSLGSSFSILPSLRKIKDTGTYRIVRHPAYLGESLMVFCLAISSDRRYALFFFLVYLVMLRFRIEEEENLLSTTQAYRSYQERIKWKLLPFLW